MSASDSPTNLAWLINQNAPTARVDSMSRTKGENPTQGPRSDFTTMQIEPEMLDRPN
jgi:hypothetical protein